MSRLARHRLCGVFLFWALAEGLSSGAYGAPEDPDIILGPGSRGSKIPEPPSGAKINKKILAPQKISSFSNCPACRAIGKVDPWQGSTLWRFFLTEKN